MTLNEDKLRQLVLLRGENSSSLSISDEEELLETAVTQLNIPLSRARGIVIAASESAGIELESDLVRVIEAMALSLAGREMTISFTDFELLVGYYARLIRVPFARARVRLKEIVDRSGIQPGRSGLLLSARWFRSIGTSSGPDGEVI